MSDELNAVTYRLQTVRFARKRLETHKRSLMRNPKDYEIRADLIIAEIALERAIIEAHYAGANETQLREASGYSVDSLNKVLGEEH